MWNELLPLPLLIRAIHLRDLMAAAFMDDESWKRTEKEGFEKLIMQAPTEYYTCQSGGVMYNFEKIRL